MFGRSKSFTILNIQYSTIVNTKYYKYANKGTKIKFCIIKTHKILTFQNKDTSQFSNTLTFILTCTLVLIRRGHCYTFLNNTHIILANRTATGGLGGTTAPKDEADIDLDADSSFLTRNLFISSWSV